MIYKDVIYVNFLNFLGTHTTKDKTIPESIEEVDAGFKYSIFGVTHPCVFCGNDSHIKIIPKHEYDNSAYIQDKGYVCDNCLSAQKLDKTRFGIRNIKGGI